MNTNMDKVEQATTDTAAVAALIEGQALPFADVLSGAPFVSMPPGWKVEFKPEYLPVPLRRSGVTRLATVGALAAYVALFPGAPTVVMTRRKALQIVACFNPHTESGPGWGDHTAEVSLALDECLKKWAALAGKWMTQEEFGNFLRERGVDVVRPDQSAMLDLVENLEVHTSVKGKFSRRAQDGSVVIEWAEDVKATTKVPGAFVLGLPCFQHSRTRVQLECRLNFRAKDGQLAWQFLIDDLEAGVDAAWQDVMDEFRQDERLPAEVVKRIFEAA